MNSSAAWVFCWIFLVVIFINNAGYCCLAALTAPSPLSRLSGRQSCAEARQSKFFSGSIDVLDVDSLLKEEDRNRLSRMVNERAEARARGDYAAADALKQEICESVSLPDSVELQIRDFPRKDGGGSTWTLVRDCTSMQPLNGPTVLQLAHAALGLAIAASERQSQDSAEDLNKLVGQAKVRKLLKVLRTTCLKLILSLNEWSCQQVRLEQKEIAQLELRGRKAADAAFWFAMAGATDSDLFGLLTEICAKELGRYGTKSSCRAKDVWRVLERLAAAGIRSHATVEEAAITALASKNDGLPQHVNSDEILKFHSHRCLLMIWKFSTRQRKQRSFLQSALKHWEQQHDEVDSGETTLAATYDDKNVAHHQERQWSNLYKDPNRPLVVDVGCGMGVSLLGLAQCQPGDEGSPIGDWTDCNFAGVDLSGLAIGYARGLSLRWGLDDRVQFFVDDAENFLELVIVSYPGLVRLCLIQFPTPYRLNVLDSIDKDNEALPINGNSQLPSDVANGFMVTKRLLGLIHECLSQNEPGKLLIQSNCEDVAVFMRNIACSIAGFECVESDVQSELLNQNQSFSEYARIPKRTLDWVSIGGERAKGEGWSMKPILPRIGRTETEVSCIVSSTPVHRCLLRAAPIGTK